MCPVIVYRKHQVDGQHSGRLHQHIARQRQLVAVKRKALRLFARFINGHAHRALTRQERLFGQGEGHLVRQSVQMERPHTERPGIFGLYRECKDQLRQQVPIQERLAVGLPERSGKRSVLFACQHQVFFSRQAVSQPPVSRQRCRRIVSPQIERRAVRRIVAFGHQADLVVRGNAVAAPVVLSRTYTVSDTHRGIAENVHRRTGTDTRKETDGNRLRFRTRFE